MTDEEVIQIHLDYQEQHKKAFRTAFDFLKQFWPPKRDPDWFKTAVFPEWEAKLLEADEEGNRLTHRLLMEVLAYLDEMAGKAAQESC